MRKLFIAAAKVFGLLQVYYGLVYATSIIPFVAMFAGTESSSSAVVTSTSFSGESLPVTIIGLLSTLALTFGIAWLLLFRATWLADKLKLPEDQATGDLAKDSILLIGVTLIGVYITVNAAPAIVSGCFRPSYYGRWAFSSVLPPAFRLSFGLLLAVRPRLVLRLLDRGEKTPGKLIIIGGLVTLALLIFVARGISEFQSCSPEVSDSAYVPLNTENDSSDQWYSFVETTPQPGTNGLPDFTSATIRDVVDFLRAEPETAEYNPAPSPER